MTVPASDTERLSATLGVAIERLARAKPFAKHRYQRPVFDVVSRLIASPGGIEAVYERAAEMDAAGVFLGSDWDVPAALVPQLVAQSLEGDDKIAAAIETVSLLRLLAVATGEATHPGIHAEPARHFLTQVLALNLRHFLGLSDEASRMGGGEARAKAVLRFVAERIGFDDVLGVLVPEIWRILEQRPIQIGRVKEMVTQISLALSQRTQISGHERLGAERLVSALFGPTSGCIDDPGVDAYLDRVAHMDTQNLRREALGFSRAMHDTGMVSDYHAAFVRWIAAKGEPALIPEALGLGPTGLDCWRRFKSLGEQLIDAAVFPQTPQAVYGLALLLDRGILHSAPIAPALRNQMALDIGASAEERLMAAYGDAVPAKTRLLAGTLEVLGLPLGVGQGANPTCQSARAISMWALNDPDYLLHLIVQAARFGTVQMHFEGEPINSAELPVGLAAFAPFDADPVSVVLVPHLDRIYAEMGRRCAPRGGDPHRWVNPEFHGWWVSRDCALAVDVATGRLDRFEAFLRRFFGSYHPEYNGGQPVVHPQPAGIAVTDASGRFVGWHAIAILRVGRDPDGQQRVYFYNPNNDSGQDWGQGVIVSTGGHGERYGEASLPFEQFAARLYLFHDDPVGPKSDASELPKETLTEIEAMVAQSWAAERLPQDEALAGLE